MKELKHIERPFDFLHKLKQKEVEIKLRNGDVWVGYLYAFDLHLNMVVAVQDGDIKTYKAMFFSGNNVVSVQKIEG